jgi:hypothetical protein
MVSARVGSCRLDAIMFVDARRRSEMEQRRDPAMGDISEV